MDTIFYSIIAVCQIPGSIFNGIYMDLVYHLSVSHSTMTVLEDTESGVAAMKRATFCTSSLIVLACLMVVPSLVRAEKIGEVSTEFIMTGPNSKIVIEAFDDPLVSGVTCHVSYPTKGGIKGALGLVEERSETSIACRQTGPITVPHNLRQGEEVFSKTRSVLFKKMHVVRFLDVNRNVLVYLAFTDKLVDGSPKHSISTVPVMGWAR